MVNNMPDVTKLDTVGNQTECAKTTYAILRQCLGINLFPLHIGKSSCNIHLCYAKRNEFIDNLKRKEVTNYTYTTSTLWAIGLFYWLVLICILTYSGSSAYDVVKTEYSGMLGE
jgi:hypothetical protein